MKYNFALDVMYITPHLHVVKNFWKFKILLIKIKFFKILKSIFKLWVLFECG
jgi:hypothetical protein